MRVHRSDKTFHLEEFLPNSFSEHSDRQSSRADDDRIILEAAGMVPLDERSDAGLLGPDLYADLDYSVNESSVDSLGYDEEEQRTRQKMEKREKKKTCDKTMCFKVLACLLAFLLLNLTILLGKMLQNRKEGKTPAPKPTPAAPIPSPLSPAPVAAPLFGKAPTMAPISTELPTVFVVTSPPTPAVVTKQPTVTSFGGFGFGGGGLVDATPSPVSASPIASSAGAQLIAAPPTGAPTTKPTRSPTTPATFGNFGFGGGVTPTDSPVASSATTPSPSMVATTTALLPNGATVVSAQTLPPPDSGFGSGGFGV